MTQTFAQSKAMHDAQSKEYTVDITFEDVANAKTFEDCYQQLLSYISISYVPEERDNALRYKDILALLKYMNKPGITIDEAKHKILYNAAYQNFVDQNLTEA